jgi:hypothetical protein
LEKHLNDNSFSSIASRTRSKRQLTR